MKLFDFAGPAIMVLIITSFMSQQIGNNNPGHRTVTMQEFTSKKNCIQAAEVILQSQPGSMDINGSITSTPGAQNSYRQTIDAYCFPK